MGRQPCEPGGVRGPIGRFTKAPGAQGRELTEDRSRRPLELRAGGAWRPGHEGPWSSGQGEHCGARGGFLPRHDEDLSLPLGLALG